MGPSKQQYLVNLQIDQLCLHVGLGQIHFHSVLFQQNALATLLSVHFWYTILKFLLTCMELHVS